VSPFPFFLRLNSIFHSLPSLVRNGCFLFIFCPFLPLGERTSDSSEKSLLFSLTPVTVLSPAAEYITSVKLSRYVRASLSTLRVIPAIPSFLLVVFFFSPRSTERSPSLSKNSMYLFYDYPLDIFALGRTAPLLPLPPSLPQSYVGAFNTLFTPIQVLALWVGFFPSPRGVLCLFIFLKLRGYCYAVLRPYFTNTSPPPKIKNTK